MTFTQSVTTCFSKYANFSGRASRSEYWWFVLLQMSVLLVCLVVNEYLYLAAALAFFLPSISVGTRRLHDTGRSGWWLLLCFVPLAVLVVLYWVIIAGNHGSNQYGEPVVSLED